MSDPDSPLNHDPIPDSSPPPPPPSAEPNSVTDLPIASVPAPAKNSRRLPPPCWSLEETIALIDAYREKWHSLNRGNLKANHWEEVAESVAANCPDVVLKKTAVQCRHKMEKLRKRYRTEIQRARSVPVARFISSWVHFKRMEAMENRLETKPEEEGDGNYVNRTTTPRFFNRNGSAGTSGGGGGIRIRIPTGVSIAQPGPRFAGKIDQKYTASPSANPRPSRLGSNFGVRRVAEGGVKRERDVMMMRKEEEEEEEGEDDPVVEIASAIKLLGDTLLRTEQTKMDMCREIEAMRMEMEMKRTEMILDSQQQIVKAFAKTLSENREEEKKNKVRRMSSSIADTDS